MRLRNFKEPEEKLARWLEKLKEFQFEIVYRKGEVHSNADALSRIPSDQHDIVHDEFPASLILPAVMVGGRSPEDIEELELELRYDVINIYDVITRTLFMM